MPYHGDAAKCLMNGPRDQREALIYFGGMSGETEAQGIKGTSLGCSGGFDAVANSSSWVAAGAGASSDGREET